MLLLSLALSTSRMLGTLLVNETETPWPVLPSRSLKKGPVRVQIAGQKFTLWRDGLGRAAAVADACPHRKAPLS
ncbi:MAG: Rieske 2Fe-2S domain-containing protein, partial [Gammaproteobacteria bacterium]